MLNEYVEASLKLIRDPRQLLFELEVKFAETLFSNETVTLARDEHEKLDVGSK